MENTITKITIRSAIDSVKLSTDNTPKKSEKEKVIIKENYEDIALEDFKGWYLNIFA